MDFTDQTGHYKDYLVVDEALKQLKAGVSERLDNGTFEFLLKNVIVKDRLDVFSVNCRFAHECLTKDKNKKFNRISDARKVLSFKLVLFKFKSFLS